MNAKTESEVLFERFLADHEVPFSRIPVATEPRPDFEVGSHTDFGPIFFEIKQIATDENFRKGPFGGGRRIVVDHIRSKISESKKQMRYGGTQNAPSVLLIYNALDSKHRFGTEDHDFEAAMFGEMTAIFGLESREIIEIGRGRNRSLRDNQNTSFSALGHLAPIRGMISVRLFPNKHAKVPLPPRIPDCFQVVSLD